MKLLSIEEAEKILKKYKIPLIKTEEVKSMKEAVLFAKKNKFPIVLRIDAPNVFHKTEMGLIFPEIRDIKSLKKAYNFLTGKAKKEREWKVFAQKKGKGIEIFFGAKKDPVFGAFSMFGLGGIFVEVINDISFSISPISKKEAVSAIKKIKGYKLLSGYRGKFSVNTDKLAEIFSNFSNICLKEEHIKEIDLNPIFANGKNIFVADPKIYV